MSGKNGGLVEVEGPAPDGRPMVHPASREGWRSWLEANHASPAGVWVVNFKLASGKNELTYADIVEEALCFGWIDSKGNKLDDMRSLLWVAPRSPRSNWSRLNKERVERLQAAGLMAEPGLRVVEAAKASGTWNALDDVENLTVPDDLAVALDAIPVARANWDAFARSKRRSVLEWLLNARRQETRAQRIQETVRLAAENVAANQWRPSAAKPTEDG
jgi:uncharacterized protein YdeI (YjbR/CyaY-like superfamily)